MVREEVEVIYKADGTVETHIVGIKGKGCSKVAKNIGDLLGSNVATKPTDEYYQSENTNTMEQKR